MKKKIAVSDKEVVLTFHHHSTFWEISGSFLGSHISLPFVKVSDPLFSKLKERIDKAKEIGIHVSIKIESRRMNYVY